MMHIAYRIAYGDASVESEITWHVGERLPATWADADERSKLTVLDVRADGHELEWIREKFENLPIPKETASRFGRWFGDMARMIAAQIPTAY